MKPRWVWHLHHDTLAEKVGPGCFYKSLADRQRNICETKGPSEHALRFRLMKYIKGKLPMSYKPTRYKLIVRLHAKECRNCPWDGGTIFAGKYACL